MMSKEWALVSLVFGGLKYKDDDHDNDDQNGKEDNHDDVKRVGADQPCLWSQVG